MKITQLQPKGSDERGSTTEYLHERSGKQLLLFRKAGTINGRHYHKGISPAKDPEIFIVAHGTCKVSWRHINSSELETQEVTGPAQLEVPPYIWHEVEPVTDCVFLELNSIEEHAADVFYLEK